MYAGFNGIPVSYDYKNKYNAGRNPSTVHAKNSGLSWFFKRYLIEKVISVFEWDGIPETWAKDYFFYTLYLAGNVAIINTDKYGVIPQHCGLGGFTVQYQPYYVTIANPLFQSRELTIGRECEVIRLQQDEARIVSDEGNRNHESEYYLEHFVEDACRILREILESEHDYHDVS